MSRLAPLTVVVLSTLVTSKAFGAYTFQFVKDQGIPSFDRYVFYALGTGAQANENIFAADLTITAAGKNDLKFSSALDTDGDDEPDTVPITAANVPGALRTRFNNILFQTVAPGYPQPSNNSYQGGDLAAYAAGLKQFQLVGFDGRTGGAGIAADASQNAGRGAALFAAVVPTGAAVPAISGQISGVTGYIQQSTTGCRCSPSNVPPVVISPGPVTVTFGSVVSDGAPFSATVTATDMNAADILTLSFGTLPAGVSGISITPLAGSVSPAMFTVKGTLAYSTNLTTVTLPFTVSDPLGAATPGAIVLNVVPEPTSVCLLGVVGALATRRQRT